MCQCVVTDVSFLQSLRYRVQRPLRLVQFCLKNTQSEACLRIAEPESETFLNGSQANRRGGRGGCDPCRHHLVGWQAHSRVYVSTQLVEAATGTIIWTNTSQVSARDVFTLQDELVDRIVQSLTLPLTAREHSLLKHDVPANAGAFECYLRANGQSRCNQRRAHDDGINAPQ